MHLFRTNFIFIDCHGLKEKFSERFSKPAEIGL